MNPWENFRTPRQTPDPDPEKFDLAMSESYSDRETGDLSEVTNIYFIGANKI